MSSRIRVVLTSALLTLGFISLVLVPTPAASAATISISPGVDFEATLESLEPGDTLLVNPGTYDIGEIFITPNAGTASQRITVRAANPSVRPIIRGAFWITQMSYWTISQLRFDGTTNSAAKETVRIQGGTGWRFEDNEVWGASVNGSYANLNLTNAAGVQTPPQDFYIVENCIHDAGPGTGEGHTTLTDHNIYAQTSGYSPGYISRNIFYRARNGAHIKIGRGTAGVTPGAGPSGIKVRYNTGWYSSRGIIVIGEATSNIVRYNLIKDAFHEGGRIGASTADLTAGQTKNVFATNIFRQVPTFGDSPIRVESIAKEGTWTRFDNILGPEPDFAASGCGGFQPGDATAARYGRYSTYFGTGY